MTKKIRKDASLRTTINEKEIRQFDILGDQWWDESGPMKPLHQLNPLRLDYIKRQTLAHFGLKPGFKSLQNLKIADIGCGGGIVAEPLCRLGARVTGVDAGAENIKVAKAHAAAQGLEIEYLATTAEALAAKNRQFDIVTALEIVEHVDDVPLFMEAVCRLVRPGGLLIMSTLNRTTRSYLFGIVAAEYVLRWLPPGTHDWKKFLKPSELCAHLAQEGLEAEDITGLVYNPILKKFALDAEDVAVNYLLTAVKA